MENETDKNENSADRIARKVESLHPRKRRKLERYKRKLWQRVDRLMSAGEFEGTDKFDFHMQTWVENLARDKASGPEDRELVLLAADIIQIRFWTLMRAVLRRPEEAEAEAG